jgi:LPXTG-motif cell wall-anchored protein
VRRVIGVLVSGALLVVASASVAWAQQYPPEPSPGGGAGAVSSGGSAGAAAQSSAGSLPRTGASNTPSLVIIGLAALVAGVILVLAVRRRSLARGHI